MKAMLLLGNFTFHHFSDEELKKHFGGVDHVEGFDQKCLIHRLDDIKVFENEEQASIEGEELLNNFESYLVIPTFNGEIRFERKEDEKSYNSLAVKM